MKKFIKDISFSERTIFLIVMLENAYINHLLVSDPNLLLQTLSENALKSGFFLLIFSSAFVFIMSGQLIYQSESGSDTPPLLRKYGCLWFLILYALCLTFYFWMDVWHLFFGNGRWEGILLFLLKSAFVLCFGIKLHKLSTEGRLSGPGQAKASKLAPAGELPDMLCAAGLMILLIVQFFTIIFTVSLTKPLPFVIGIMQWVLLLYGSFGMYFRTRKQNKREL